MLMELMVAFLISTVSANSGHPTFELMHEDFSLEQGYKAEVICSASGEEPLQYYWHDKDSNEIPADQTKPVHIINAPSESSLIFDVFIQNYEGLYTCHAKNTHGVSSKVYNITAHPVKNETVKINSVKVIKITDSSVTFSPSVTGQPSGYIVKYIEAVEKIERTLNIPASAEIEISELIPSGNYTFQFAVQSASEWTTAQGIILLPEAPEVILRSLGSGTLKIEWFRKFNDTMRKTIDHYKLAYRSVGMMRGSYWVYGNCFTNITIPDCARAHYTVSGLEKNGYQDFYLSAHTKSGYGKSTNFKVYME